MAKIPTITQVAEEVGRVRSMVDDLEALILVMEQRKASGWTRNRAQKVLAALSDLQAAISLEAKPLGGEGA